MGALPLVPEENTQTDTPKFKSSTKTKCAVFGGSAGLPTPSELPTPQMAWNMLKHLALLQRKALLSGEGVEQKPWPSSDICPKNPVPKDDAPRVRFAPPSSAAPPAPGTTAELLGAALAAPHEDTGVEASSVSVPNEWIGHKK